MRKFTFRLERLLGIKEYIETEAKLKYAHVLQKKLNLENENKTMKSEIGKSMNDLAVETDKDKKINYEEISLYENYITNLIAKIKLNISNKNIIEKDLTVLRNKLAEATKEKKILEELKKRKFKKYKKEMKKEEIKHIDEIAGQLEIRKKNTD